MIIEFSSTKDRSDSQKPKTMHWTAPYREYEITYVVDGVELPKNQTWVQLEINFGE